MSEFDDMLRSDPLYEAEQITGKSYKEDRATAALGMLMALNANKERELELGLRDDTSYNTDLATQLRIFEECGFTIVHTHTFTATYPDDDGTYATETFFVLFDAARGILATCESFMGTGRNSAKIYFNLQVKYDSLLNRLPLSGHMHGASYDQGVRLWVGDIDAREALRHNLAKLEEAGTFCTPWVENPFLWLLDYSQTKGDYDYQAINAAVIATLPQEVQDALAKS